MTQISLISKRHSLNTACMDALAHLCEGPTSGPQTLIPPYPPKQPLERLASGNISDKKSPPAYSYSASHTPEIFCAYILRCGMIFSADVQLSTCLEVQCFPPTPNLQSDGSALTQTGLNQAALPYWRWRGSAWSSYATDRAPIDFIAQAAGKLCSLWHTKFPALLGGFDELSR